MHRNDEKVSGVFRYVHPRTKLQKEEENGGESKVNALDYSQSSVTTHSLKQSSLNNTFILALQCQDVYLDRYISTLLSSAYAFACIFLPCFFCPSFLNRETRYNASFCFE